MPSLYELRARARDILETALSESCAEKEVNDPNHAKKVQLVVERAITILQLPHGDEKSEIAR